MSQRDPTVHDDEEGAALEQEFADVLGALRGFEPVDAPAGLEERIAMSLKAGKDRGASPETAEAETETETGASRGLEPGVSLRCVFCHEGLARAGGAFCASCLAPHHPDCFREHGRCSAPGCEETRWVQPRDRARRSSGRSARSDPGKRRRPALALVGAGVLASLVAVAAVRIMTPHVAAPVRDEQAMFEEYKRLDAEALQAFREFNRAEKAGNLALAAAKHEEAHALWTRALDLLNGLLDGHRGPDGFTLAEYEGYEEELSRIATHLVDLEKRDLHAPPRVADALARARQRLAAGDLAGARADVDLARQLDPTSAEARRLLAELEATAARPAEATSEVPTPVGAPGRDRSERLRDDELGPRALLARARQRLEAGRFVEARADLYRVRAYVPDSAEVQALLAEVEAIEAGAAVVSSASSTTVLDGLKSTVDEVEALLREGHVSQAQLMIGQGRTIVGMLRSSTDDAVQAALPDLERRLDRLDEERRAHER